jgi:hypothetical protein
MWIAVGHGPVLWGVDYGHDLWFKQLGEPLVCPGSPLCPSPTIWREVVCGEILVGKNFVQLDVGRDGHVWAVDSND